MSKAPIMPFYTDAWLGDTLHLSAEEQGAYLLLLLHCWRRNGEPLPDDDRMLARVARVPLKRWQVKVRPQLEGLFDTSGGCWRQAKLERVWAEVMRKSQQARHAAQIRHGGAKSPERQHSASASAGPAQLPSMNQDPINHDPPLEEGMGRKLEEVMRPVNAVLNNVRYFLADAPALSADMQAKLRTAQAAMQQALQPCGGDVALQQVQRLWRHYRKREGGADEAALQADYAALLRQYPADVVVQAVSDTLVQRKYPTLPPLAELKERLEPPLTLRRHKAVRMARLLKRS